MLAPESSEHDDVQQAAHLAIQPGARPHRPPAVLGDELLHRAGKVGGLAQRTVDVFGAEHLTPGLKADLELRRVVHTRARPLALLRILYDNHTG